MQLLGAPGLDLGSGFDFLLSFAVIAKHRPLQHNFFEGEQTPVFQVAFCGKRNEGEGNQITSQSFGKSR